MRSSCECKASLKEDSVPVTVWACSSKRKSNRSHKKQPNNYNCIFGFQSFWALTTSVKRSVKPQLSGRWANQTRLCEGIFTIPYSSSGSMFKRRRLHPDDEKKVGVPPSPRRNRWTLWYHKTSKELFSVRSWSSLYYRLLAPQGEFKGTVKQNNRRKTKTTAKQTTVPNANKLERKVFTKTTVQ